ncbi:signal recognition particle, SRP9/SRP14 subunit [Trametopsis cervina]|nr:signal recognition particle, SRP9/SRP14 subunit [Trametopsis cervina]
MVYISSWQDFQEAAESLYDKSPNDTRYSVKWRASEGRLVLKITDDNTCIKFKTYSSVFLNRFEALNLSLMQKMQNSRPAPQVSNPVVSTLESVSQSLQDVAAAAVPAAVSGVAGGGVKKKKPKKKK